MPSQLVGLFRTLAWSDYPERQEAPPGPGQTSVAAFTDAMHALSARPEFVPGTKKIRLADTVTCTISLDQTTSFKKSWVMTTMPQADRDALLSHEQGHYDIHALLARDFFLQIMQLKLKTYTSALDLNSDINAAQQATVDKSQAVEKKYDDGQKRARTRPSRPGGKDSSRPHSRRRRRRRSRRSTAPPSRSLC
jgi:hypothetical protein